MVRNIGCLAVVLLVGTTLRAGELDSEFGVEGPKAPAATLKTIDPVNVATAPLPTLICVDRPGIGKTSELDAETPAQSCWGFGRGLGWGGWGFGRGLGWGGWGFGRGLGWGGWGFGRGLGWGGWGLGWGGGYLPWSGYSPFLGLGYYGGWGCW